MSPEPRFARIAAMIGDATRARMLGHLLSGEMATAGELAAAVDVSPQTASAHLAKLVDAELLAVRNQGRHRYFKLADADVAHALEALSLVAERDVATPAHRSVWDREDHRPMRHARTCYGHLAGRLGVALHDALLDRGIVCVAEGRHHLGDEASRWLADLEIDAASLRESPRGIVYPCVDWSERRDHFAGPLAVTLLDRFVERRWLVRAPQSRALSVTPIGRSKLAPIFGTSLEARWA